MIGNIVCRRAPSSGAAGQALLSARPTSKSRDRLRRPVFLLGERSERFAVTLPGFPEKGLCDFSFGRGAEAEAQYVD
jgi:hypothetical protein